MAAQAAAPLAEGGGDRDRRRSVCRTRIGCDRSRPPRRGGRPRARGRARPLQRRRGARRAARRVRRRAGGARRRSQGGHLHRLDGARRTDRGALPDVRPQRLPPRRARPRDAPRPRGLGPRPPLPRPRHGRGGARSGSLNPVTASTALTRLPMVREPLLPPESLERYADAIVRASLGIEKGDTLVVQGQPEHRELLVAVAGSAYRAGARFVDVVTADPLVMRARLLHGSDDALGALSPWSRRQLREASGAHGALAHITGEGEVGYLDDVPPT